jgi:N-acetylmuramoyl-L-alanine amidase
MRRTLLTALLLALSASSAQIVVPAALASQPIYVAYPASGQKVAADHVIFEGSVLPGASLSISGRPIPVGPDGLFSEWLPLRPGVNALTLISVLNGRSSTLSYTVSSVLPARLPASPARILPGTLTPDGPWVRYGVEQLAATDRRLSFSFSGSPGGRALFWAGRRGPFSMTEAASGRYSGGYTLGIADAGTAQVRFLLIAPGGSRAQATAPGSVGTSPGPRYAEVTAPDLGRGINNFQAGWSPVGGPNLLYPRQGTRFAVIGEGSGTFLTRLPTSPELPLLDVTRNTAKLLPPGTSPMLANLSAPSVADQGTHLQLRLPLGARVPYVVTQAGRSLSLALYDTQGFPYALNAVPLADPLLAGLTWSRSSTGPLTATLTLNTDQQWGYDLTYEGTTLLLQVRRPPPAAADTAQPLGGRTIVVDPGHGGSELGGAGPLRVQEKDLVLDIALQVGDLLRAAGAKVVLTRDRDVQVPLYDRGALAETADADVLLSIHANALPDGTDPRTRRGSGLYWTHPQALPLALSIQQALQTSPALAALGQPADVQPGPVQPGDDGLHLADLALTRPSTQLSVLVETAYLTDPGNLRTLMSQEGRAAYAQAIVQGVLDFYGASSPALPAP